MLNYKTVSRVYEHVVVNLFDYRVAKELGRLSNKYTYELLHRTITPSRSVHNHICAQQMIVKYK